MASPVQFVGEVRLREIFNEHIWPRIERGELSEKIKSNGWPGHGSPEPPGTRSQMVAYLESSGRAVAIAHRYLRPDGTIGGSGLRRPDPKWLIHEGHRYQLRRP
jgi:hypothetical protein